MNHPRKTLKIPKRLSLRVVFVALTICCISIGWYVLRAQHQRACVSSIIENGGSVIYSYPYKTGKYDPASTLPGPQWLRDLLGLDYFDQVYGVDFSNKNITELPDLSGVSGIRTLWLRNTNVADLAFASKLHKLESLWIADTRIASLAPIAKNNKLKWLGLEGTEIQDLSPLTGLPDLRTLNIARTDISSGELERFAP